MEFNPGKKVLIRNSWTAIDVFVFNRKLSVRLAVVENPRLLAFRQQKYSRDFSPNCLVA